VTRQAFDPFAALWSDRKSLAYIHWIQDEVTTPPSPKQAFVRNPLSSREKSSSYITGRATLHSNGLSTCRGLIHLTRSSDSQSNCFAKLNRASNPTLLQVDGIRCDRLKIDPWGGLETVDCSLGKSVVFPIDCARATSWECLGEAIVDAGCGGGIWAAVDDRQEGKWDRSMSPTRQASRRRKRDRESDTQ
jgi:hypothetical protein